MTLKLSAERIAALKGGSTGSLPEFEAMCDLAEEALRLRPIVAEVADGVTVSEHYVESTRHTCSDCGAEDQRSPRVMHSAECIVSRARALVRP